jgi:hypothetical protein
MEPNLFHHKNNKVKHQHNQSSHNILNWWLSNQRFVARSTSQSFNDETTIDVHNETIVDASLYFFADKIYASTFSVDNPLNVETSTS